MAMRVMSCMRSDVKLNELEKLEEILYLFKRWLIRHEIFIATAVEKKYFNLRHAMEREKLYEMEAKSSAMPKRRYRSNFFSSAGNYGHKLRGKNFATICAVLKNLCYGVLKFPLCNDLLAYDNGCTLNYLCSRAQMKYFVEIQEYIVDLRRMNSSQHIFLLIGVALLTKREKRSWKANNFMSSRGYRD